MKAELVKQAAFVAKAKKVKVQTDETKKADAAYKKTYTTATGVYKEGVTAGA